MSKFIVPQQNGSYGLSPFVPFTQASELEMSDDWYQAWLDEDIVDVSENAEDALEDMNESIVNMYKQANQTIDADYINKKAQLDQKIATLRTQNAPSWEIESAEKLRDQLRDVIVNAKQALSQDMQAIVTANENAQKQWKFYHEQVKTLQKTDDDNLKGGAANVLQQQANEVNTFGRAVIDRYNNTTDTISRVLTEMDDAVNDGRPSLVTPRVNDAPPATLAEARSRYSEHSNRVKLYYDEIEQNYADAKFSLTTWHTNTVQDLDNRIQHLTTVSNGQVTDEIRKYTEIRDKVNASFQDVSADINNRFQEYERVRDQLNNDLTTSYNGLASSSSTTPPETLQWYLDSQLSQIQAFRTSELNKPMALQTELNTKIIQPYSTAIRELSPPAQAITLAAAPSPLGTTPTAPTNQSDALLNYTNISTNLVTKRGDIEQEFQALETRIAQFKTDKTAEINNILNSAGFSDADKENAKKIQEQLDKSVESIQTVLQQTRESFRGDYTNTEAVMNRIRSGIEQQGQTTQIYERLQNDASVASQTFLAKHINAPTTVTQEFQTRIESQYTNIIDMLNAVPAAAPVATTVTVPAATQPAGTTTTGGTTTTTGGTTTTTTGGTTTTVSNDVQSLQNQATTLIAEINGVASRSDLVKLTEKDSNNNYAFLSVFHLRENQVADLESSLRKEGNDEDADRLHRLVPELVANRAEATNIVADLDQVRANTVKPIAQRIQEIKAGISTNTDMTSLRAQIEELKTLKEQYVTIFEDAAKKQEQLVALAQENDKFLMGSKDPADRRLYPGNMNFRYTYGGDKDYNQNLANVLGGKENPIYNFLAREPGTQNGLSSAFGVVSGWARGFSDALDNTERGLHKDDIGKYSMLKSGVLAFLTLFVGGKAADALGVPTWMKWGGGLAVIGYFLHGLGGDVRDVQNKNDSYQAYRTTGLPSSGGMTSSNAPTQSYQTASANGEDQTSTTTEEQTASTDNGAQSTEQEDQSTTGNDAETEAEVEEVVSIAPARGAGTLVNDAADINATSVDLYGDAANAEEYAFSGSGNNLPNLDLLDQGLASIQGVEHGDMELARDNVIYLDTFGGTSPSGPGFRAAA